MKKMTERKIVVIPCITIPWSMGRQYYMEIWQK